MDIINVYIRLENRYRNGLNDDNSYYKNNDQIFKFSRNPNPTSYDDDQSYNVTYTDSTGNEYVAATTKY